MKLLLRYLLFTLFAITLTSVNVFSQTATIATDQPDYAPGSTVIISGTGWQPGETVTLQVIHDPTGGTMQQIRCINRLPPLQMQVAM